MGQTQGLVGLLDCIVAIEAPHLRERVVVQVCYQQKLFIATPHGSRVVLRFGRQSFGNPDLIDIVKEAVVAAEAILYGRSTAASIRMDPEQHSATR